MVTQYISKTSLESTLNEIRECAVGSRLGISYVDQKTFYDPVEICGRAWGDEKEVVRKVDVFKKRVERSGEPWISGYTKEEMKGVLEEKGWKVEGDVCMSEMIEGGKFERGGNLRGVREWGEGNYWDTERFLEAVKI